MEVTPLSLIIPDFYNGPKLQAAVNQAIASKAAVWIPADYAGTDTYTNPSSVPVFDMRGVGTTSFSGGGSLATVIDAALYGVVGDGKSVNDATWSNSQNPVAITITASDPPFAATDTGKMCYGPFTGATVGTFTYTDATHGFCSGTSTTAATGTGNFVVGTDNGAKGLTAWNALLALPRCGTIIYPQGIILTSKAWSGIPDKCSIGGAINESGGLSVFGQGTATTLFGITPNFDFSGCVAGGGCMFSPAVGGQVAGVSLYNFTISGFGQVFSGVTCGSGSNSMVFLGVAARMSGVALTYGLTSCANNITAITMNGQGDVMENFSYTDTFGKGIGIAVNQVNQLITDGYSGGGGALVALTVGPSGILVSNNFGLGPVVAANVATIQGTWYSTADYTQGTAGSICLDINSGGNVVMTGGKFSCATGTYGLYMRTGSGTFTALNTSITGGSTAALSGDAGAGTYLDLGNNTFTGTTNPFTGSWRVGGPQALSGTCTGVATPSQTIFLYPLGALSASTCTVTAENLLTGAGVVSQPGTIHNLRCTATAGGTNASSGVVTVRKNGTNTTTTATFGTGTTAKDSTHSSAVVVGDIITIQFTTQAAETLAGVACQVQIN